MNSIAKRRHRRQLRAAEPRRDARAPALLARLAGWCFDRRKRVLLACGRGADGADRGRPRWSGANFQNKFSGGNSESARAQTFLQANFPSQAGDTAQVVFRTTAPDQRPGQPGPDQRSWSPSSRPSPMSAACTSPTAPAGQFQVSPDGHIAYATVQLDKARPGPARRRTIQKIVDTAEAARAAGFEVELGGQPISAVRATAVRRQRGHRHPGRHHHPAGGLRLVHRHGPAHRDRAVRHRRRRRRGRRCISRVLIVPTFGTELAAMIGIGVGIDYALFIVTRYRQGLAEGRDPAGAVVRALDTSGRAVLFAGSTVVISLLGMLLHGPAVRVRAGLRRHRRRAVRDERVAHPAARLPGLRRHRHRPVQASRSCTWTPTPAATTTRPGTAGAGVIQRRPWPAAARRPGRAAGPGRARAVAAAAVHRLRQRPDRASPPARPTTCCSQGFGPGSNGPLVVAVDLGRREPGRRRRGHRQARGRAQGGAGRGLRGPGPAQPGGPGGGDHRHPQDLAPEPPRPRRWCTTCATT